MIRLRPAAGKLLPVFACDSCHAEIPAGDGFAVTPVPGLDPPPLLPVYHAHAGRCAEDVEDKLGGPDHAAILSLKAHAAGLAFGCGLSGEVMETYREMQAKVFGDGN